MVSVFVPDVSQDFRERNAVVALLYCVLRWQRFSGAVEIAARYGDRHKRPPLLHIFTDCPENVASTHCT